MDWRENTVSMGLSNSEEFDLTLATVTISDRRIVVEPNDVEDWAHIFQELGKDIVLEEVYWDEVKDVSITVRDLYYPHINIRFKEGPAGEDGDLGHVKERRIFFIEDEREELMQCLHTIQKYWNKWRQNTVIEDDRFADEVDDSDEDEPQEEVELMDALRNRPAPAPTKDEAAGSEPEKLEPETRLAGDSEQQDEPDESTGSEQRRNVVQELRTDTDTQEDDGSDEKDSAQQEQAGVESEGDAEKDAEDADEEDGSEDDDLDDIVDQFMDQ